MGFLHALSGRSHAIAMLAMGDVVANGSPSGVLHRDALALRPLPQSSLLVIDSDIDLLVDFDTSHRGPDLFAFAREVEQLLGRKVEVGTEVHPVIRDKVEAEAVIL
jgi:hypothetical protein